GTDARHHRYRARRQHAGRRSAPHARSAPRGARRGAMSVLLAPAQPATTPSPQVGTLLAVRDISVARGTTMVLRDVSFELHRGEALGLIGEPGAGKSMIGRLMARQLPVGFAVTKGAVDFARKDLLALPAAAHRDLLGQRIAFIPQEPMSALSPSRTVG